VQPEAAVRMINEWVKKATDNLIDSMISTDDINTATDLVLANAVYFKGDWMEPFQPHFTSPGTFHRLDRGHVEVDFMAKYWRMDVACMDGFKVLKLPYKPCAAPPAQVEPAHGQLKRRRGQVAAKSKDTPSTEVNESTQYSMFVFLPDTHDGMATMVDVVTASRRSCTASWPR
jgi:serpin B